MRDKIRKNQQGFSIVETVLLVVAVAVISTVGWFAYQHNRPKVSDAKDTNGSQSTKKPPVDKDSKPTVAYLKVKEWGVKLPLSEEIKDAYYVVSISNVDENGQPSRILLGLKSLDKDGCLAEGSNRGEDSAIAAIVRVSPTEVDPVSGELISQILPGVTIGNYFYGYQSMLAWSTCKAPQPILQSVDTAFIAKERNITKSID